MRINKTRVLLFKKCGRFSESFRYYVAVVQNPKRNLNRSKISDALNAKNRVKGISVVITTLPIYPFFAKGF